MLKLSRKLCVLAIAATVFSAQPVFAAAMDVAGGAWFYNLSGSLDNQGNVQDLRSGLRLGGTNPVSLCVTYYPEQGWWPNFGITYDRISASGSSPVTSTTTFGPLVFTTNSTITSQIGINDLTFRFDVPFKLLTVNWGAGLLVKYLYGHAIVSNNSTNKRSDYGVNEAFPMPYLRASAPVPIPFVDKHLSLYASGAVIQYQGQHASQWQAGGKFEIANFFVMGGYKSSHYITKANGYNLNAHVKGPMVEAGYTFH